MAFKPAKQDLLRTFVVLDGEAVLSGLAALDGGAVDEILTRTTEDKGGNVGGSLGSKGTKVSGGRKRDRKVEEEMRRKTTEHSAASALIDRLTDQDAIGEVDGVFDEEVAASLQPGMTIRLQADVALHPLHQVDLMFQRFMEVAPTFGQQDVAKGLREILPMWKTMVGSGDSARLLFDVVTQQPQVPRVVMPIKKTALQVAAADVPGMSSILTKVDRVLGLEDQLMALRMLHNAPAGRLEIDAISDSAAELVEGFTELGVECTREDVVMSGPLVVLRPICVWR